MSVKESLIELPAQYSSAVFGQLDEYAKKIEKTLKVTIIARDSDVKVIGAEGAVKKAAGVLNNLIELARRGNQITEQNVDYALSLAFEEKEDRLVIRIRCKKGDLKRCVLLWGDRVAMEEPLPVK